MASFATCCPIILLSQCRKMAHRSALSLAVLKKKKLSSEDIHCIEKHWHDKVINYDFSEKQQSKGKKYILSMFPYPSGKLHMGHVRVYTISDCLARYNELRGYEVIHPMGWDAFGLPAENAAIERNLDPEVWTESNIAAMKKQLVELGCRFDWTREIATFKSQYYRWTQWLFLQLYKAGLVYQKRSYVNWDPVDCTVLADEQIDERGCSWRSGAAVVQKPLLQWFVKTSFFAKALYDELDNLVSWQDVVDIQRHWIGKCDSYRFKFKILNENSGQETGDCVDIFVDRLQQLCSAKAVAISSKHICSDHSPTQIKVLNPVTNQLLPVFVTDHIDYVGSENARLVSADDSVYQKCGLSGESGLAETKILLSDEQILERAKAADCGGYLTSRRLNDWVVSRQRFWGTPIPIVHCSNCKAVPVPESQLPVTLPTVHLFGSKGKLLPLHQYNDWLNTVCPECGKPARRECDTLDTFFDSSWYYLRFLDPQNDRQPFDSNIANQMMPVDIYIGGKEHAALHLFYARFMCHFLRSIGFVASAEPFSRLLTQGMVMAKTYKTEDTGEYIPSSSVIQSGSGYVEINSRRAVTESWEKMSKSKHNGIDPQNLLDNIGCDFTRLLITSNVSPQSHRHWDTAGLKGVENWLNRVRYLVVTLISMRSISNTESTSVLNVDEQKKTDEYLKENYNHFVREVTFHLEETFLLNVAISRLQGFTNSLRKCSPETIGFNVEFERCLRALLVMIFPFAPNISSELWSILNDSIRLSKSISQTRTDGHIWNQPWPLVDEDAVVALSVYINGMIAERIFMNWHALLSLEQNEAMRLALQSRNVAEKIGPATSVQLCNKITEEYREIERKGFYFEIGKASFCCSKEMKKLHFCNNNQKKKKNDDLVTIFIIALSTSSRGKREKAVDGSNRASYNKQACGGITCATQSSFASWKTGIFALLLLVISWLNCFCCCFLEAIPDAAVGQKLFCTILPLAICHGGCGACFFFHYILSEVKSAFFVQQAELLPSAINHWSVGRLLQPAVALRRASLKRATPPLWALWFDKCLVC
ncbi:Leucine--tRNA ligase [Trichinella spiralis]|uniref:leucine--tRNA ligase n=1 Tax=Trichinella spiralis TaxID=6334 RepID=A0ABR3KRM6_TRISP